MVLVHGLPLLTVLFRFGLDAFPVTNISTLNLVSLALPSPIHIKSVAFLRGAWGRDPPPQKFCFAPHFPYPTPITETFTLLMFIHLQLQSSLDTSLHTAWAQWIGHWQTTGATQIRLFSLHMPLQAVTDILSTFKMFCLGAEWLFHFFLIPFVQKIIYIIF